jgi:hypothetical protein
VRKIVIRLEHCVKVRLRRIRREAGDKGLAIRCQVVLPVAEGRRRAGVAESPGCSVSWVNRVVARFRDCGVAGLHDRREDNGTVKRASGPCPNCTTWWTAARGATATRGRRGRGSCWRR